jgi:hypothetical protein
VLPVFVMPLNRSLPPLEFCRGTNPSHAANWRPFLKAEGLGEVDPNRGTSGTGFLAGNVAAPTSSNL